MNDYERARLRFEKISRSRVEIQEQAQAIIDWAYGEWDAAMDSLRLYESAPGIELPEYRRDLTVPCLHITGRATRDECGCPICLDDLAEKGAWTLTDAAHEAARIARDA
jgi:hypothetical protein